MPPLPKLTLPVFQELDQQLRFAPAKAIARDLDRIEQLAGQITPSQVYPQDWVVFRITGYRPEIDNPSLIPGSDLICDLSALLERLSDVCAMSFDDLAQQVDGSLHDIQSLCQLWSVSRKTIERFRNQGLVARRVVRNNRRTIVFTPIACQQFQAEKQDMIDRACAFSRNDPKQRQAILDQARQLARQDLSLNQAAARIAADTGRSLEGIRQLLITHDHNIASSKAAPIFQNRSPWTPRQRIFALRAHDRALEPRAIATRIHKPAPSVSRAINRGRIDRLLALDLHCSVGPTFSHKQAWRVLLLPDVVTTHLGQPGILTLSQLLDLSTIHESPPAEVQSARAVAHALLIYRASRLLDDPRSLMNKPMLIDEIETSLLWAARLRAELVRARLPLILQTLESTMHQPLTQIRSDRLKALIEQSIDAAARALERFDPFKGGNEASPMGMAVSKLAAAWVRQNPHSTRAAPTLRPSTTISDWTRSVTPWQAFLEPPARVHRVLDLLSDPDATLLCERFGWQGPPSTLLQIADHRDRAPMHLARTLRKTIRHARRLSLKHEP